MDTVAGRQLRHRCFLAQCLQRDFCLQFSRITPSLPWHARLLFLGLDPTLASCPNFGVHLSLQLAILALELLQARPRVRREPGALAPVTLDLADPLAQGLGRAAELTGDRANRRPLGRVLRAVLLHLGHEIARTTVKRILHDHWIDPAPERSRRMPWKTFLQAHGEGLTACDRFTVEVLTLAGLQRYLSHGDGYTSPIPPSPILAVGLIRFRGHVPKGGYDVHDAQDDEVPATTPAV